MQCPGCLSQRVASIETLDVGDLITLYASTGVDVTGSYSLIDARIRALFGVRTPFFRPGGGAAFYESLQRFDWYYQDQKPEYLFAKRFIRDGAAVLEVGCGKGAFRAMLPHSVCYTGLEFNDEAVRKARALGLNVKKGSIEEHADTAGAAYDVVCSFQVLEHVSEAGRFVASCVKATKRGGCLLIAVPAEDSFLGVAANAHLNMPPHHLTRWTDDALCKLANRVGLDVQELWHEPVADYHRHWHGGVLARHFLNQLFFRKFRLTDDSIFFKVVSRLLRLPFAIDACAGAAAALWPRMRYGHTVVLWHVGRQKIRASGRR